MQSSTPLRLNGGAYSDSENDGAGPGSSGILASDDEAIPSRVAARGTRRRSERNKGISGASAKSAASASTTAAERRKQKQAAARRAGTLSPWSDAHPPPPQHPSSPMPPAAPPAPSPRSTRSSRPLRSSRSPHSSRSRGGGGGGGKGKGKGGGKGNGKEKAATVADEEDEDQEFEEEEEESEESQAIVPSQVDDPLAQGSNRELAVGHLNTAMRHHEEGANEHAMTFLERAANTLGGHVHDRALAWLVLGQKRANETQLQERERLQNRNEAREAGACGGWFR